MNHDYIPGGDAEFNEFQTVSIADMTANGDWWGISIKAVTELRVKGVRWNEAYATTCNAHTRTHADVVEKQEAHAEYEKEIRKFVKGFIAFNSKITSAARDKMGLTVLSNHLNGKSPIRRLRQILTGKAGTIPVTAHTPYNFQLKIISVALILE